MYNTNAPGNKISNNNPFHENVPNATTCQTTFCQAYSECKYFVYNKDTAVCILKKEAAFVISQLRLNVKELKDRKKPMSSD